MATVETIGNPKGNIHTDENFKTFTRGVKAYAGGIPEFTLLHYNEVTGKYDKAVLTGGSETTADALLKFAVENNGTEGVVLYTGGIRASLIAGYVALTDAEKFRIVGELADKKVIVGDL